MCKDAVIDINELKDSFRSCFRYKITFSADKGAEWDGICQKSNYVPVDYLTSSLQYQREYVECFNESVIDMSIIIYGQNGAVCVWPITLIINDGKGIISTNEKEVLPPFFTSDIPPMVKNNVISDCFSAINAVIRIARGVVKIDSWQTRCSQQIDLYDNSASIWYRRCMESGGETDIITDLYVDLELELDTIHSCLRKSYKSLINKADKLWNTEIINHLTDKEIRYFRERHIEVAGRETRSLSTWLLQKKAVNEGHAFVIKLSDDRGNFVGESLFEYSRDEGSYSVGVYNRELYNEPVSHIVQWTAIRHMKAMGLKKYRIGQRFYPGKTLNLRTPTEKELSISYFKEGFATSYIHTFIVTNHFDLG